MSEPISDTTKIVEVFHEARIRAPGAARDAFLADACGADAELRAEVKQLLAADEQAGDFLEQDVGGAAVGDTEVVELVSGKPGDLIGRYKLPQQIGEGGFGIVWMAEQVEPVSRKVALKIIKPGMDTREVIARFEAERQALAMMDHPHIAKVLDAGATDQGRPYFVMELVKGVPVTGYCDEAALGTRERLRLFGDICSAINHAHQKGVIHRDIKPSNVMVTLHGDKPVVKVIDFGIAKATQGRLTERTLFTRFEQFVGTPVYMSPEQTATSGLDIDTRSDIYSLGILLYELLTGQPPFDAKSLASAGYEEMRRIIREVEPPRPSMRLSTLAGDERTSLAKVRRMGPEKLERLVEPDLDWIVMKAIEKDRARRYETADGLARDVERFLADEPVSATPPGAAYRFRKFARRNRVAMRVAATIAAVLVVATAVSTWQAVRATRAAERAQAAEKKSSESLAQLARERDAKEQARLDAEAVSKFLTEVFASPDPERDGRTITVAESLDKAVGRLETELAGQPERRAKLQSVLGQTYLTLGLYREAAALDEKVYRYHQAHSGPARAETLNALGRFAVSCHHAGRLDEAIRLQEEFITRLRDIPNPAQEVVDELHSARVNLANFYHEVGRFHEALQVNEEELKRSRELFGPEDPRTISLMHNLASCYANLDRAGEALQMQEEVTALRRKVHGPDHRETLAAMHNLAMFYGEAGRYADATAMNEEVLALRRKMLGSDHPDTLKTMSNLSADYSVAGRNEKALTLHKEVVAGYQRVSGRDHPLTLGAAMNLAVGFRRAGRLSDAIALAEPSVNAMRRVLASTDPILASALDNLAELYEMTDRADEASRLRSELAGLPPLPARLKGKTISPAFAKAEASTPEAAIKTLLSLGQSHFAKGDYGPAIEVFERALSLHRQGQGPADSDTLEIMNDLALCYAYDQAQWDRAVKMQEEVLSGRRDVLGPEHRETLGAMTNLAVTYGRLGRLSEAVALQEQSLSIKRRVLVADDSYLSVAFQHMADLLDQSGRGEEAAALREEFSALSAQAPSSNPETAPEN